MNKIEKILDLLSHDSLSVEEKKLLSDSFEKEPELANYKAIYNFLENLNEGIHIDSDLISEYVLYKNNLSSEVNSVSRIIPKIEDHLSRCTQCQEENKLFSEEFNEIDKYLEKTLSKNEEVQHSVAEKSSVTIFNLFTKKYIYSAAAAVAFFAFSLFTTSSLIVPSYMNINELSSINYSTTRGRVSPNFHNGLTALSNNNYDEAIAQLKRDIKNHSDDKTIFYTNYMLGLVYLQKSESDLLGLFRSFDAEDINNSIVNFKEAIDKNMLNSFSNITFNSYFFIGKGYMLIDDFESAKNYLQKVVANRGGYTKEAQKLLDTIDQKM